MMEGRMYNSWNCAMFLWGKLGGNKREEKQKESENLQSIAPLLEFQQTLWPHRLHCSQHHETCQLLMCFLFNALFVAKVTLGSTVSLILRSNFIFPF